MAVVDIGSNSIRLVVFDGARRSPTPLFNEKLLCGLGRGLATNGRLSGKSMNSALRALRRYRAIVDQLGVKSLNLVATAAAREAENGADFIARAEQICRAKIHVLSGGEEALISGAGVIAGTPDADGLGADMGGGSLEVFEIKGGAVRNSVTLPLGGLRLLDHSQGDMEKARVFVDEHLAKVDWLENGEGHHVYAVGGTWRAFGRLHMAQTRYPLSVMHGYRISRDDTIQFARLLDHLSPSSLDGIEDISKQRREMLPFGALVLERFFKCVRPSDLVISAFGLREGVIYRLLNAAEKARDPLIVACEELAQLRARSAAHARELCDWTDAIFTSSEIEETDEERRLRHAGCLLSDIGWRAHPEYRGEQSLDLVAHASFAGIDHPGRAYLGLAIYFRHQGIDADPPPAPLMGIASKRLVERASVLGAAIRVAHTLSAAMPGIICATPVRQIGGTLALDIPKRYSALNGERLEHRFYTLARELDLTPDIRIGGSN